MSKSRFNQQHREILDSFLLKIPGVVPGKMFGYPAYYMGKKLFACLYEEGVGIKVPEALASELNGKEGILHFQPMGRAKMREWIQINRKDSKEYLKDQDIFDSSIEFVSSTSKANKKR
jgi:hypothetical protein